MSVLGTAVSASTGSILVAEGMLVASTTTELCSTSTTLATLERCASLCQSGARVKQDSYTENMQSEISERC